MSIEYLLDRNYRTDLPAAQKIVCEMLGRDNIQPPPCFQSTVLRKETLSPPTPPPPPPPPPLKGESKATINSLSS